VEAKARTSAEASHSTPPNSTLVSEMVLRKMYTALHGSNLQLCSSAATPGSIASFTLLLSAAALCAPRCCCFLLHAAAVLLQRTRSLQQLQPLTRRRTTTHPRIRRTVIPDAKYAASHEWAKVEGNTATIGISDHAQSELGDVVYVELPEVGATVTKGETFGVVESVKVRGVVSGVGGWGCANVLRCWLEGVLLGCALVNSRWGGRKGSKRSVLSKPPPSPITPVTPPLLTPRQAASDVYSPLSGKVVEINEGLVAEPAKVRSAGSVVWLGCWERGGGTSAGGRDCCSSTTVDVDRSLRLMFMLC